MFPTKTMMLRTNWRTRFEDRAAILEYDGEWPRAEAERLARVEVFGSEFVADEATLQGRVLIDRNSATRGLMSASSPMAARKRTRR
jgi:hypothetical protein